jgi:hypothetical protein
LTGLTSGSSLNSAAMSEKRLYAREWMRPRVDGLSGYDVSPFRSRLQDACCSLLRGQVYPDSHPR